MSGHPGDPIQPKDADDPVARFFAAERDAVTDASADDLRWQTVLGRSRRARRTAVLRYVAAAAAVVVLGGATVWGVSLRSSTAEVAAVPQVTRTVYVPASPAPAVTSTGPSARAVVPSTSADGSTSGTSAPATGTAVPADFRVVSLTTVASGRLFALGSMSCGGTPCAGVATSGDDGRTWSLRSSLTGETVPQRSVAQGSVAQGSVGRAGTVTDVRFADDGIGWAYGADVLRTTDGGRTWAPYPHTGGGAVVDLATDGTDVVLATASSCDEATCTGPLTILRAPKTAGSASSSGDVAGTMSAPSGVRSLRVAWHGARPVVSAVNAGGSPVTPVVVAVAGLADLQPPACAASTTGRSTQLVAPASGTGLYALCPVAVSAGATTYATYVTGDLGSTWAEASGPGASRGLQVPSNLLSASGTDAEHLLVASPAEGSGTPGTMSSTADGGGHWSAVAAPPRADGSSTGWRWVGSPGGSMVYAVADTADGGFWRSTDHGTTWSQVRVAG